MNKWLINTKVLGIKKEHFDFLQVITCEKQNIHMQHVSKWSRDKADILFWYKSDIEGMLMVDSTDKHAACSVAEKC